MSNQIFPTLPGLAWSITKTPVWSTRIQQSVSGKEVRTAYRSRPVWKFALSYEILRGSNGYSEYQQLLAFYNARQGAFDSFLFTDTSDNTVTAQPLGTGDGVTTTFTLTHTINGWTEPIGWSTTEQPYINGAAVAYPAGYSAGGTSVTFTTAPASGAVLTWSGTFYYRVRFDKDMIDFEQFMQDLWLLKKCDLVGVI